MPAASTMRVEGVGGRTFDLAFFFGSALLAYCLGVLILLVPSLVLPLWWAWVIFVEGPHLLATWVRTYFDPEERARRRSLLLGSTAILAFGPAAWLTSRLLGRADVLELFVLASTLWSVHHFVRQHYGIVAVLSRHAHSTPAEHRIDSLFLYATLWLAYALFLVANPLNRAQLRLPVDSSFAETSIVWILAGGIALASISYISVIFFRVRRQRRILASVYALCVAMGVTTFGYLVVGSAEPLVQRPITADHRFLGMSLVVGVCHGIQYLGLAAITSARRARRRLSESPWKRAALHPWFSYGCFVVVSVGIWGGLNASSGLAPNVAPFGFDTPTAQLFLAIYWSVLLHHFYLDQKIWRLGDDAPLRFDLNLQRIEG